MMAMMKVLSMKNSSRVDSTWTTRMSASSAGGMPRPGWVASAYVVLCRRAAEARSLGAGGQMTAAAADRMAMPA